MINDCPCCGKTPKIKVTVSCQNVKCLEFEVEHFVWDWQKLTKPEKGETHVKQP